MLALATPLLTLALGAIDVSRNPDWIAASESSSCDLTDIDFSDRLHGFATCAFGNAMTTDDGGLSWTVFGTDLQQSLLFEAVGPQCAAGGCHMLSSPSTTGGNEMMANASGTGAHNMVAMLTKFSC